MTVWNRTASGGWSASSTGQSASSLGYGGSSSSKSSSSSSSSSSSTKTYTYTKPDGTKGTTTDYRHSDAAKAANAANSASTSTSSTTTTKSSGSGGSGGNTYAGTVSINGGVSVNTGSGGSVKTIYDTSETAQSTLEKISSGGSSSSSSSSSGSSGGGSTGGGSGGGAIPSAASLNSNIPTQTVTGNITPANFAEQGITVQVDRPDALAARDAAVAALAAQGIDYYKDLTAGQQSALITNIMHGKQDTTYIDNDSRSGTYQYATPGTPVTEETYNTLLGIQSTEPQNSPAVFAEAVQNYVDAGYTPTNIPTNPQPTNIPVETPTVIGGNPQPTEIVINIPEQEDNTGDSGISDLLKSMFLMNLLGGSSGGGSGTSGDTAFYPVETGTAGSSSGFDFGQFFDRYKVPIFGIIALAVVILIISKAPAAKSAKRSTKA